MLYWTAYTRGRADRESLGRARLQPGRCKIPVPREARILIPIRARSVNLSPSPNNFPWDSEIGSQVSSFWGGERQNVSTDIWSGGLLGKKSRRRGDVGAFPLGKEGSLTTGDDHPASSVGPMLHNVFKPWLQKSLPISGNSKIASHIDFGY
jgi:hypothetical protein